MKTLKAQYVGRRSYEIIAKKGNEEIKEMFYEPFFNNKEEITKRIMLIVESLNIKDIEIDVDDVWYALSNAAKQERRKFTDILIC